LGDPDRWIRHGSQSCKIRGDVLDPKGKPITLELTLKRGRSIKQIFEDNKALFRTIDKAIEQSPGHYLTFGYGVTRRLSRQDPSPGARTNSFDDERARAVATLFSGDMVLQPLQKTVVDLDYRFGPRGREQVRRAFAEILPGYRFREVDRESLEVLFDGPEGVISLDELSDGFKSMGAWWGDLFHRLGQLDPGSENPLEVPGLLLIDEIDLHLHPNWQRELRGFLEKKLPNLQIVATSHSPFVLQSLKPGELLKLDGEIDGDYADQPIEDIAEDVMDVEIPQRGKRFEEMTETAGHYYDLLEEAEKADSGELARIK
jgi:hypothetical protein